MPWWLVIALVTAGGLAWLYTQSRRIDEARYASERERALADAARKPALSNRPVEAEGEHPLLERPLGADHWNPRIKP